MKTYGGLEKFLPCFATQELLHWLLLFSPFRKMRRFARGRVGENQFLEVYVSTDFETCCKRDPKGLYKKNIKNFTGKDSGYEKPENPEIVLDTIHFTPQECAKVVYQEILKRMN